MHTLSFGGQLQVPVKWQELAANTYTMVKVRASSKGLGEL